VSPVSKKATRGLGRGIDVLLPQDFDKSLLLDESERIKKVDIDLLFPNPDQPRKEFSQDGLSELAASIKRHGLLQPIIVTPSKKSGEFLIMAGERRWRAAKQINFKTLPVIVRSSQEIQQLEIALVENVQRVDLSPIEQAESIERLHQQFNLTYEEIARRLGKAGPTVNNLVRLLQLPPEGRRALQEKSITEGHARQILALREWPDKQVELLSSIVRHGWSVRQAERFVVAYRKGAADIKEVKAKVNLVSPETKKLSKHLSAPVTVRRMANGGKLEIGFKDENDLSKIMSRLLEK
jgi:ParB family chromosome partitioning protein